MEQRAVELVAPASGGIGKHGALQLGEAAVIQHATLVGGKRWQVAIEELEAADALGRPLEPQGGAGDDGALAEPGTHGVEQIAMLGGRAAELPAIAGHDLEFEHLIGLEPVARRGAADAAHGDRAAHRQAEIVGEHRWRQPVLQRRVEDAAPGRASLDRDAIRRDLADGAQCAHVDDHSVFDQRTAVDRMALPAWRDLHAVRRGLAQQPGDVRVRRRPIDGARLARDEAAEIRGRLVDGEGAGVEPAGAASSPVPTARPAHRTSRLLGVMSSSMTPRCDGALPA